MPKPNLTPKTKKKEEKQQDYTSLFYDKGEVPVNRRQQRDELAELYRQKDRIDAGGYQSAGAQNAALAQYYANRADYSGKYGDQTDYLDSYRRYNQAMADAGYAYRQEDRQRAAQSDAYDWIMNSKALSLIPETRRARAAADWKGRRLEDDAAFYSQMAQDAAAMGNEGLYQQAKTGYDRATGQYADAAARYWQAMEDSYSRNLDSLEQTDKGRYLYTTSSREDVASQLALQKRRLAQMDEQIARLRQQGYDAQNMTDNRRVSSLEELDRQIAAENQLTGGQTVGDFLGQNQGTLEDYQARRDALADEIAAWERAQSLYDYDDYLETRMKYTRGGEIDIAEREKLLRQGQQRYNNRRLTAMDKMIAADSTGEQTGGRVENILGEDNQDQPGTIYDNDIRDLEVARHLSDEDLEIFYILYAKDPKKAEDFIHQAKLDSDDAFQQSISGAVKDKWWLRPGSLVAGTAARLVGGAANLIAPYSETALEINRVGNALVGGAAQGVEEHGIFNTGALSGKTPEEWGMLFGGKGLGDAYQLGSSMLESGLVAAGAAYAGNYGAAAAKVAEFIGTAIMGSGAAASDYDECIKRGMDRQQAMVHATSAGIAEAAFEYLSIDKLVNQDITRGFLKNIFVQGGIEASEEACTTIANRITDGILARQMGYDSSVEQRVKELIAMGVDRREAERTAEREWMADLINDALGGFISGGLMTAGNTVVHWDDYQASREQMRRTGQTVRQTNQTRSLEQYATDNDLGWYGEEVNAEAVNPSVEAVQSEEAEGTPEQTREEKRQERQQKREQKRQLREQTKQDRQIGSDTQRVQQHLNERFAGKTVEEQTALRDKLVEQYGNGIAPAVYEAISVEAAKKAASLKSADEIRAARDQAVNETQDLAMKRAIADGYDQAVFGQAMRSGNADEAGRYFQQLRNTGEGGMTLEATVKDQDGQSRQIAITGITEDGKGVKLADGTTVAVSKLQADADTMDAVQRISEMEMGADADAVLQAYIKADKKGVDGYRWLMDYSLAYEQGRTNKLSLEEAVKRSSLDQRTVMEAYTLGQREAHQSTKDAVETLKKMPKKEGITGKTSNIDTSEIEGVTLNESEREQFELANKIFSLIGVDVKWVATAVKNGRFVGANGSYLNGVVTLDVHAGRNFLEQINSGILATTGHELTHFLQQYAPEQYQALKEFLFRQIVQSSANGETRLERLIWEKQRRASSKLSRKAAEDEVVAEACQTMLRDSKAIREFAQQDEEAAKGVARWMDKWFGKLKQAFSRSAQLTEEARFVDSFAKEVREAFGKLWDEALREAVEVHDRVGNIQRAVAIEANEIGASEQMVEDALTQHSDRIDEKTLEGENVSVPSNVVTPGLLKALRAEGVRIEEKSTSRKSAAQNSDRDTKYLELAKDPKKNEARLQEMVDEEAKKAGYKYKGYHGTAASFTVFDKGKIGSTYESDEEGFFFTTNENEAELAAGDAQLKTGNDERIISAYLKIRNPLIVKTKEANGTDYFDAWKYSLLDRMHGYDADGIIIKGTESTTYVVLDSDQIKSADPVTYDDSGNVIPLSERFNRENEDIRYSERDNFAGETPVEAVRDLIAVHNMTEQNLRDVLDLGGFPSPSIAIVKAANGHTNYGPISVVFKRDSIDPALNKLNKIYGADAWTPTSRNSRTETEVDTKKLRKLDEKLWELNKKIAGGAFSDASTLVSRIGYDGATEYSLDEILDRVSATPGAIAAYLADKGISVEPVTKGKQYDPRGNDFLRKIIDAFGSQQLADIMARQAQGEEMNPDELAKVREIYLQDVVDKYSPALKQRRGLEFLRKNAEERSKDLGPWKFQAFVEHAWDYYEHYGNDNSEIDYDPTLEAMKQAIDPEHRVDGLLEDKIKKTVGDWLRPQIQEVLGKKGIYNGKDLFTQAGTRRSFWQLHDAYTLENIVKAMNRTAARGNSTFGVSAGSLQAVSAPEYKSISEVRANKNRLARVDEENYKKIRKEVEDRIPEITSKIAAANTKASTGNTFEDLDIIADLIITAANGPRTVEGVQRTFQRESEFKVSKEQAKEILQLYKDAANIPTEYFEAKPQRAMGFDEVQAVILPSDMDHEIVQGLQDNGVPVMFFEAGNDAERTKVLNALDSAKFSERDYDLPSDLELMDEALQSLSEPGGEEYWKALLETDPGLAEDVKGYKDQAKKLAEAEKRLADYKKQMQMGGNRKLNTRGIPSLSLEMMKTLDASDAKGRGVAKQVTQTLTSSYQKALDAIDKGTSDADAWDIVYNNGVVPAAEIIAKQGTHSEKTGRGWITTSLESYYGEGGMQAIIDTVAGYVGADFATNRYRKAIQPTIADRIVERTEKRMQKQVDAATERATEAERINEKLTADRDFWKNQQAKDSETVTFLNERLKEARQDLRDNKSLSAQERRKLAARIKSLQTQLQAKSEEIRALKSLSQQLDKQAVEFGQKQAKLLGKLEQQVQREHDILAGKLKPLGMQRLLKDAREQAAKKAEQHKDEVFANYKEQKKQTAIRNRIKNLSDEMKRRMTNPSERAYVPASLYGSMAKLADVLDGVLAPGTGTKAEAKYRSMMDAIHGLAREYSAVKDLDDPTYSSEYDEEIQEAISDIERILERKDASWIDQLTGDTQKGLRELETGELQRIYELMRQINYSMVGATSMLGFTSFKNVFDAMQSVVGQMQNEKSLKSLSHHEKAKRLRMLDNLSVMRAVEMMSGWDRSAALYQLFHAIEQGTDASWAWVMDYNKSLQDLKTGKNEKAYRKALTEALDFGITDDEGLKVTMTKMQAIQILMTAEREAHNDKLLHLQTGGAVIRNAEDIQNGKGAKATSQTVKVTPELLQKIRDSLTEWDQAYMKAVRSYFQKEGRRTNEIMYKLKHRVLQTEKYYVPYSVDKNYLETNLNEQQAMSMWVKTPGSTNALQQKAKQPVIIDGLDAVMERHVKEIADYIGLALPIRDFSKVYNGMLKTGGDNPLPVKETIDRAFGSKGQHLLTQAVIDVQGGSAKQNWSSGISDFLSGLQSAFVRSALLINPSVTIKQAASYIAAESILSHRALVAGNRATFSSDETRSPALIAYLFANPEGKTAQRIYNEIDRYTSLHYQRRMGMSQAEIANEANRTGKLKRRMNMIGANMEQSKIGHAVRKTGENLNPVTWIQRMDVATTATLWVACKEQAKLDGMKAGTAEFWQHTTELYERCLRETQPMYDGLHRTANQKQAGGLMQYLFPFRTVPIQNHGQLAASYEALKASKNKSKAEQAAARKFFAKTVWAQTESAFVFSMMTFLAAALKRKTKKYRDEDEEFTAVSFAKGLLTDVGSTLFSVLQPMYGSELVSLMSRAADRFEGNSGYTYDAFSVGVVDMLNDLASSGDKLVADAGKLIRGEDVSGSDFWNHSAALLLKGAKLAGIPADTVKTYIAGAKGNVQDIIEGRIPALNDESWDRATGVNAKRFFEAWEARDEAKMQTVLNEVQRSGKSEDSVASAFNKAAKDAYENNGLSLEQYADYLEKTGMFDAEKIFGKVKNLVRDEFQAGERSEDEAISALTGICGMDVDTAWKTVQRWEAGAEHEGEEDYIYSQYEELREALDAGKSLEDAGKEYLAHGYTEEQIAAQAVSWLKERFTEGSVTEKRAIQLLKQFKSLDEDAAWKKVQEWKAKAAHADDEDYSWSQYDEIDAAIDGNKDIKALVQELTSHGVEEKSVTSHVKSYLIQRYEDKAVTESQFRNQLSRYCGIVAKKDVDEIVNKAKCFKETGYRLSNLNTSYLDGEISADKFKQIQKKYGGMSDADAKKRVRWLDLKKAKPDLDVTESQANTWYDGSKKSQENRHESAQSAGMSIERYLEVRRILDEIKDTSGNRTGEDEFIEALSKMNLKPREKAALYYERYKGTTKYSKNNW